MKVSTPRVIRGFGYEPYVYDTDGQEKRITAVGGNILLGTPDIPAYKSLFPEALTPDKTISISYNSTNGTVVVDDNQRFIVGDRFYSSSDYDITKRTFTLSPSTVYHLRFSVAGQPVNNYTPPDKGFYLVSLSDTNYNPNGLPLRAEEWNRPDDFVVADIITDTNGTPTIYKRKLDRMEALRDLLNKLQIVYKEVWVDSAGDDRNDGSQEAPFKTLDRALQLPKSQFYTPWNSYETAQNLPLLFIHLAPAQTFDLSQAVALNRANVYIYGDATNKPTITNQSGGSIRLRWSGLHFDNCNLNNSGGFFIRGWGGMASRVSFYSCNISIGALNFIEYGIYQHCHVVVDNSTITKTSTGLLVNCSGSALDYYRDSNTTIQDSAGTALTDTDIIGGIVRDANGLPRNVRSNIVL